MNITMKKIKIFLFAAISILTVASCEREELLDPADSPSANGGKTVLTLSFDKSKTTLVDGKTTWLAGDKVRIFSSTGKFYEDVAIPADEDGKDKVEVEVNMKDTEYYAVYPVESAVGIDGGSIRFKIPSNPDGRFASANICAAKTAEGMTELEMRNLTAVLKINVASGNVVEFLQFNSQNPMVGEFKVNVDDGVVSELTTVSSSKSASVAVGAVDGDYYIPVLPGDYDEEFSVTALRGNGGYQTLTTSRKNEVSLNQILDMGTIGDNLSTGLEGDGTEANPYVIKNIGEYGAFASSVNVGNTYAGKFVKLDADIEGVNIVAGYYASADVLFPFKGTFDGNGHTVTLNIDGGQRSTYLGMFGYAVNPAVIKNVNVAGSVTTEGNYAAGLVASALGTSQENVLIENCTTDVAVTAGGAIGGIAGYTGQVTVKNCKNTGKISGTFNIGGISGYAYYTTVSDCENSGEIVASADGGRVLILANGSHAMTYLDGSSSVGYNTISTLANGGITGWTQNSEIKSSTNSGPVTGVSKLGGVCGSLYWSTASECVNTGAVTGSQDFVGGIVGWAYTSANIIDNVNSGTITGRAAIGGIAGMTNNGISSAKMNIRGCKNTGEVKSVSTTSIKMYNYGFGSSSAAGGIIGYACEYYNGSARPHEIVECVNDGTVSGVGQAVGGIVGMRACPLNNCRTGFMDSCVNNGTVTCDLYRAGGIVGVLFDRFTNGVFVVRNCVNHGDVKAPFVIGGIVGWSSTAYPTGSENAKSYGLRVLNNYNDGKILYNPTKYNDGSGPYVGGIVGYDQQSWFENNVNYGVIGPDNDAAANEYDSKLIGEIAGNIGQSTTINYYYSKSGDLAFYGSQVGTTGRPAPTIGDISGKFGENGEFEVAVVIGDGTYEKPAEALNAWIGDQSAYTTWTEGDNKYPVFVQ